MVNSSLLTRRKPAAGYFRTLVLTLGAILFLLTAADRALAQHHDQTDEHATSAQQEDQDHQAATSEHAGHGEAEVGGEHGEAAEHGEGHGEAHGGHGSMPHLVNLVGLIAPVLPEPVGGFLEDFVDPIFSLLMILVLSIFFIGLSKELSARNPGRKQMAVEALFGGLYGLFQTIIGPTARRYTPFLGTLFIFIICNNFFGMIPLGHASTSSFAATTFALGAMTFLYVQGIAIKENGILGYLHHLAGSPKTGMDWGFSVLLFPLHVLGELIKPISLSLRLFGNIFGEDTLVATMVLLGGGVIYGLTGFAYLPGLPLQFPFYFLGLLSCTIQALVFTLLATVYIALMLPHDDHGEEHGH